MKKKLFDDLIATTQQAVAHSHGENVNAKEFRIKAPDQINVRAIRDKLNMTQDKFADTFDFTVSAVKKWESGARTPEGPARMLLHMIAKDYKTVLRLAK